ncbi:MAG: hypothetical protein A2064_01670 [Spirochaetes bacterium GWB1_66_5]|nr:MAG: hypothetical protein A2064_01670 [Spirochaetes bacterium GWB1_66_5]
MDRFFRTSVSLQEQKIRVRGFLQEPLKRGGGQGGQQRLLRNPGRQPRPGQFDAQSGGQDLLEGSMLLAARSRHDQGHGPGGGIRGRSERPAFLWKARDR